MKHPYKSWRIGVQCLWAVSATIVAVGLTLVVLDIVG
jgi:hypothetical protein